MKRIVLIFAATILFIGIDCSSDGDNDSLADDSTDETEQEQKVDSTEEQEASSNQTSITNDLVVHYIDAGQADATSMHLYLVFQKKATQYCVAFF